MSGGLADDIYDDLYGDSADAKDPSPSASSQAEPPQREGSTAQSQAQSQPEDTKPATGVSSLPAKPSSSELSYSAQIAQQFSAYKQTPAQERQSRPLALQSPGGGDEANGSQDGRRAVRPSEMKDEGKLFVGGLSWDTTDEGLRKYFSEFGEVEDCTILRDQDGRSRGFAFLTFKEPSSVNAVMVREHVLDGKAIDPKRAIPREEHLRNTRYFVGGLSHTSTSDTMRAFFNSFGKVVDCTVMVDRESGRSKGFGFVTFEDASNTDQLVGRSDLILDDKTIEVKVAQPRNQRDQSRMSRTTRESTYEAGANSLGFQVAQQRPGAVVNPQQMSMLMMGQLPMMNGGGMPGLGVGVGGMAGAMGGMHLGMGMGGMGGGGGGMGMMPMSPQMGGGFGMGGMARGMGGGMVGGMGGNMRTATYNK